MIFVTVLASDGLENRTGVFRKFKNFIKFFFVQNRMFYVNKKSQVFLCMLKIFQKYKKNVQWNREERGDSKMEGNVIKISYNSFMY